TNRLAQRVRKQRLRRIEQRLPLAQGVVCASVARQVGRKRHARQPLQWVGVAGRQPTPGRERLGGQRLDRVALAPGHPTQVRVRDAQVIVERLFLGYLQDAERRGSRLRHPSETAV